MKTLVFNGDTVAKILEFKSKLRNELEAKLGVEDIRAASRDWHARRKPIPCGMTIHTGIGCSYGCLYCYIYDMGFPARPEQYPLSGLQLVYALTLNPYFVPGAQGTLLAFGSVTEPFLEVSIGRTLEYLRMLRDHLGNPQQISTKSILDDDMVSSFIDSSDPSIDVLITITTLKYSRILEPGAPSPYERFDFASKLAKRGVHVTLFMRPLIPGVVESEVRTILEEALSHGVRDVVPGTLRVTPSIMRRLRASRVVDIGEIERRLTEPLRDPRRQVTIRGSDLKDIVVREARRLGLRVHPASCSSNINSHNQACAACKLGPCGPLDKLPLVEERGVIEVSKALNVRIDTVRVENHRILVECNDRMENCEKLKHYIIALARREPRIKFKRNL